MGTSAGCISAQLHPICLLLPDSALPGFPAPPDAAAVASPSPSSSSGARQRACTAHVVDVSEVETDSGDSR